MFPIKQNRPPIAAKPARITELGGMPHLTSAEQVSAQPTNPSHATATMPDEDATARTLEEKIWLFNTDERTNVLVSMLDNDDEFSMTIFKDEFTKRRKAFDSGDNAAKVNFSASLFTPATDARLYRFHFSRLLRPDLFDDWETFGLPKTLTRDQRDQLDTLIEHHQQAYATLDAIYERSGVDEDVTQQAIDSEKAAKIELAKMRLALWEGHPEVVYCCPNFAMGYLIGDHAKIQNAFPQALGTRNRRYEVSLDSEPESKLMAHSEGNSTPKRDKNVKKVKNSIVKRRRDDALAALRKHMEKRKQTDQLTEVLIGAPDDDLAHVVDGFFLEMRSGFETMDLATVNLYLCHSRKTVQERMAQTRGFPLLVCYTDKNSGRNKFAYVSLNPEGIPVATE